MSGTSEVTISERVALASAAVQWAADVASVRVLHIKGPAAAALLGFPRSSSDVDVWVDPDRIGAFVEQLAGVGFQGDLTFLDDGWAHSVELISDSLGAAVDVHWRFPGIELGQQESFDLLWQRSGRLVLGGRACTTLDRVAHALLICLHAARSPVGGPKWQEADTAYEGLAEDERQQFSALAEALRAQRALGTRLTAYSGYTRLEDHERWSAYGARDANRIWRDRVRAGWKRPHVLVGEVGRAARRFERHERAANGGTPWAGVVGVARRSWQIVVKQDEGSRSQTARGGEEAPPRRS